MALIIPGSTIKLYGGVQASGDNSEELIFKNASERESYFSGKLITTVSNTQMVRKTGQVKIHVAGNVLAQCNYFSFINPSFDNKIYYCKIINYDYQNNECAIVDWQIDWWITDMFAFTMDASYIDREHLSQRDFALAENNPYDPSILEFRTSETLPLSDDTEKPIYTYGNSNLYDGIFCGDAVCNDHNLPNNIGLLMVFSDINLANADVGAGVTAPSATLNALIRGLTVDTVTSNPKNNLCAYKLSKSVYDYLSSRYTTAQTSQGELWNTTALGQLTPFSSNRIDAPVSYIYCDNTTGSEYDRFCEILGWFTDNSVLDNILGIYAVPNGMMMFSASNNSVPIQVVHKTFKTQNVVNKKLDLYPYSYYKLIAPNGDVKELRPEFFQSAMTGSADECRVGLTMDVLEKPNLLVAPVGYKGTGLTPNNSTININGREGLIFSQWPCMPYAIDGFRAHMAAVANSIIGNNTLQYQYDFQGKTDVGDAAKGFFWSQAADSLKNFANDLSGAIGDNFISNAALGVLNFGTNVAGVHAANKASGYNKMMNEEAMSTQAYDVLNGSDDNAIYKNFEYTKPAYVGSIYNQVGDGSLNYNENMFIDIIFQKVSINPTILAQYDNYFTCFGYKSGRFGKLRAYNYMRGASNTADLPAWATIEGKKTTYVKTENAHINGVTAPSSNYISGLLNRGVRLVAPMEV